MLCIEKIWIRQAKADDKTSSQTARSNLISAQDGSRRRSAYAGARAATRHPMTNHRPRSIIGVSRTPTP
jgi:hypothetical protein